MKTSSVKYLLKQFQNCNNITTLQNLLKVSHYIKRKVFPCFPDLEIIDDIYIKFVPKIKIGFKKNLVS